MICSSAVFDNSNGLKVLYNHSAFFHLNGRRIVDAGMTSKYESNVVIPRLDGVDVLAALIDKNVVGSWPLTKMDTVIQEMKAV